MGPDKMSPNDKEKTRATGKAQPERTPGTHEEQKAHL